MFPNGVKINIDSAGLILVVYRNYNVLNPLVLKTNRKINLYT